MQSWVLAWARDIEIDRRPECIIQLTCIGHQLPPPSTPAQPPFVPEQ